MLHVKFGWILFSGFGEEDFNDGRHTTDDGRHTTNDGQMMITKAHLEHSSGELKILKQIIYR